MDNKVLIIAGMHRSGTSLVTQWLYRCGLHVGENLLGKGIGNDDGHYEDLDFYDFHRSLLSTKNLPDSGFVKKAVAGMTPEEKEKAREIISVKNEKALQWGWKDPRTCLFLKDYDELIPEARYMVIFRDFQSTVSSLINRTYKVNHQHDEPIGDVGFFRRLSLRRKKRREIKAIARENASEFLKVWLLYNREILNFINSIASDKFLVVNYEALLNQDLQVLAKLNTDWQFSLDPVGFLSVFKPGLIGKDVNVKRFVPASLYQEACDITGRLKEISIAGERP